MKDTTPTIFIIFGITGDIASRKILPALLSLYVKKKISSKFAIIGFTPEYINKEDFRQSIRDNMGISPGKFREEDVKHFVDHIFYEQGYYDRPESYFSLLKRLKCLDDGFKQCSNKLFHLSVAPSLLKNIVENLSVSGLSIPCEGNGGWTRIIIEKPFGYSETSAIEINNKLLKIFTESQIFRTDYYLAKDVIQNILSFRFSNSIFEPLWNRNHIEKVHIKLYKSCGIEDNGSYYDKVGALRDIGQSHLLQILALLSMEKPKVFDSEHFRKEKANIFKKLVIINKKTIQNCFVKAQYEGYKHEKNISEHAQTETYFRLKTNINNKRWKNIPFYLEGGKALSESKTEIDVYFNNKNIKISENDEQNILTFRIQPEEGIKIRFWINNLYSEENNDSKNLKFKYSDSKNFILNSNSHERIIIDAMDGNQTLFTSMNEQVYTWKYIDSIISNWQQIPLGIYKKGSRDII